MLAFLCKKLDYKPQLINLPPISNNETNLPRTTHNPLSAQIRSLQTLGTVQVEDRKGCHWLLSRLWSKHSKRCCSCLPTPPSLLGESISIANFYRQSSNRAATPEGSLHKSRADSVVRIAGQLKRCCVVCS